ANLEALQAFGGVDFFRGDVRSAADCARALDGAQAVYHLAGLGGVRESFFDPARWMEVNARGTAVLLSAMARQNVRRCVLASSSTVYGDAPTPFCEDAALGAPLSPYARSKQTAELVCSA